MNESSTLIKLLSASRGRWKRGGKRSREWTREGKPKEKTSRGDGSRPLYRIVYERTRECIASAMNLGGTADLIRPKRFPFGAVIFWRKKSMIPIRLKERWRSSLKPEN